jgi:hypothetical protein
VTGIGTLVDVTVAGRAWITGDHAWHVAPGDPTG